ncbi:hypothetical protein MRB53_030240 [Persea americana]|uniref:Uncharacterized protein n=1 Tax=Persea americana TaxID=3435 RepID=A0ACC2KL01_PERAE|nr:hypothetical protein MRB53_030240 [Persea americana]
MPEYEFKRHRAELSFGPKIQPKLTQLFLRDTEREMEMGEALVARYWCHICSQMVNPVMEAEMTCPYCQSGFVEEMNSRRDEDSSPGSDRALSLWAPILLGMMGGLSRRPRIQRQEVEETQVEPEQEGVLQDSEPSVLRRRSSSSIFQFLQGPRSPPESDRERVIFINPFNPTLILQGSFNSNETQRNPPGSLGGFFFRPGLDLLLQHLLENDPSRYGTAPAKKEVVEAIPSVKVGENLQCSICLDDFDMGSEAKEMPCKHKFHSGCIVPWLELHSTCPVCRFELPSDGPKVGSENGNNRVESEESGSFNGENGNGRRFWVPVPWPFNGLFSLAGSQDVGNSSSAAASESVAPTHEN